MKYWILTIFGTTVAVTWRKLDYFRYSPNWLKLGIFNYQHLGDETHTSPPFRTLLVHHACAIPIG